MKTKMFLAHATRSAIDLTWDNLYRKAMLNEGVIESSDSSAAKRNLVSESSPMSVIAPNLRQRRILAILANGDLIWEISRSTRWTLFNPRTAKDLLLTSREVADMDVAGWIQRNDNREEHRLDSWEISPLGRETLVASHKTF
jgi:hypothetical protein